MATPTIQAVSALQWRTYQASPSNLFAQYQVDLTNGQVWNFGTTGSVAGSPSITDQNSSADGVVIDNTNNSNAVAVTVGNSFLEQVPAFTKSMVILGGSSPYVRIQGDGQTLATFYKGSYPGSISSVNALGANMSAIGAYLPAGIGMMYYGLVGNIPAGWLLCDGSAVSRVTYAALWQAIGIMYGAGDGASTFNLPDSQGMFPRGWDNNAGRDVGRVQGTLQQPYVGYHQHRLPFYINSGVIYTQLSGGQSYFGSDVSDPMPNVATQYANTAAVAGLVGAAFSDAIGYNQRGIGQPNADTRPVNFTTLFIVKT